MFPSLIWVLAAPGALLALIPLLFVGWYAIDVGWSDAWELIVRRRVGELLYNTARLVGACMACCAVIGVGAAWLIERTTLPGRRIWNVLLVVPLAIPAFVNGFGWVSLTSRVEGFGGALLIVTLSYYPLVYLPAAAALRGLDPALEETARSLGQSPSKTFVRVVVPQLRTAVVGGSLLVGLHLLAEFGALQMLRFPTFTTAIYDQYRSSFNGPAANMLAGVLVAICLILLLMELRVVGRASYARVGGGVARSADRHRLGRLTAPALLAVATLVGLALVVPIGSLVYWLTIGTSTAFPVHSLAAAAGTSAALGVVAAIASVLVALPIAWVSIRRRSVLSVLFERSTYIAASLPGIVVALALVTVSIRFVQPAYQTVGLLLCAYVIMFLPRVMVSARAALQQAPPLLDDVAHALGAGPLSTMRRVTIPLIKPGLGAGAALVFLAVVTELTATLLLAPIGMRTLATEFWASSASLAYGAAAPFAMVMVMISMPATYLLMQAAKRTSESAPREVTGGRVDTF